MNRLQQLKFASVLVVCVLGPALFCGGGLSADKELNIKKILNQAHSDYFPKGAFSDSCSDKNANKNCKEDSDKLWDSLFSIHLRTMKELPLLKTSASAAEVYRFLYLPSFNHPVVVRIERSNGRYRLVVKELDGVPSWTAPGKLIKNESRNLSSKEWNRFIGYLDKISFWTLATNGDSPGLDGADYVLEAVRGKEYHVVHRWSSQYPALEEACMFLFKLAVGQPN